MGYYVRILQVFVSNKYLKNYDWQWLPDLAWGSRLLFFNSPLRILIHHRTMSKEDPIFSYPDVVQSIIGPVGGEPVIVLMAFRYIRTMTYFLSR